jgi:hypothetical protein
VIKRDLLQMKPRACRIHKLRRMGYHLMTDPGGYSCILSGIEVRHRHRMAHGTTTPFGHTHRHAYRGGWWTGGVCASRGTWRAILTIPYRLGRGYEQPQRKNHQDGEQSALSENQLPHMLKYRNKFIPSSHAVNIIKWMGGSIRILSSVTSAITGLSSSR